MSKLVECVPNCSEGRRPEVIEAIADEARKVPGVKLLDVKADASHNRVVVTFVGEPQAVKQAAFNCCKKAAELNAFLQYLEPAQDVLGEYNDNVVGHAHYQEKAKQDPNALFAMGWFGGREQHSAEACAVSLKTVKNAPKFW